MAEIIPLHPADPPCDVEYEPQRKALETLMDPFIEYGSDIRIPDHMRAPPVSDETRRRFVRAHCGHTASGWLRACADIPGPIDWRKVRKVAANICGFLFMVAVAAVLAIGMFWDQMPVRP